MDDRRLWMCVYVYMYIYISSSYRHGSPATGFNLATRGTRGGGRGGHNRKEKKKKKGPDTYLYPTG